MISEQHFWLWVYWQNGEPLDALAYHYNTTRAEALRTINKVSTRIDMIQAAVNREAEYAGRDVAKRNHRDEWIKVYLKAAWATRLIPIAILKSVYDTITWRR